MTPYTIGFLGVRRIGSWPRNKARDEQSSADIQRVPLRAPFSLTPRFQEPSLCPAPP
jgi:hypothetical protein